MMYLYGVLLGFVIGVAASAINHARMKQKNVEDPRAARIAEIYIACVRPGDTVFWQPDAKRLHAILRNRPRTYIISEVKRLQKIVPDGVKVGFLAPGDKLEILKVDNAKN